MHGDSVDLEARAGRTVVFVCLHGAGKSRIAAAWFNWVAPPGSTEPTGPVAGRWRDEGRHG